MTLRELTQDMLDILALAEEGELDEEALKDTFEGVEGAFEDKCDGYAEVIAELNADADKLKAEIKRLTERKSTIENNISKIKSNLEFAMRTVGKEKFKTEMHSFGIQKNGGLRPLLITGFVPMEFYTTPEPVVDNNKVREFLKDNTCEWAELGEYGTHLTIR